MPPEEEEEARIDANANDIIITNNNQFLKQKSKQNQLLQTNCQNEDDSSSTLESKLECIINRVLNLETLQPNSITNAAFSQLVTFILNNNHICFKFLSVQKIQDIRSAASTGEYELEKLWAKQIIATANITISEEPPFLTTLQSFPYYQNYVKLIGREIYLLRQSGLELQSSTRCLFIGAGPLSLSSILFHQLIGGHVDVVDICSTAIELSKAVTKTLGLESNFGFIMGDALQSSTYSNLVPNSYDVICIAALAGFSTTHKQLIIQNVLPFLITANNGSKINGRILLRSALNARELLYPCVEANDLAQVGLNVLIEYHPIDDVINSVIICSR